MPAVAFRPWGPSRPPPRPRRLPRGDQRPLGVCGGKGHQVAVPAADPRRGQEGVDGSIHDLVAVGDDQLVVRREVLDGEQRAAERARRRCRMRTMAQPGATRRSTSPSAKRCRCACWHTNTKRCGSAGRRLSTTTSIDWPTANLNERLVGVPPLEKAATLASDGHEDGEHDSRLLASTCAIASRIRK